MFAFLWFGAVAVAAKPVTLDLVLTDGSQATVTSRVVDDRASQGKPPTHVERWVRHQLTVESTPAGHRLAMTYLDGEVVAAPEETKGLILAQHALVAGDYALRLSPEWRYVGADGMDAAAARGREQAVAFLALAPPEMQAWMKPSLDAIRADVLEASAIAEWPFGVWAGRNVRVGKSVHEPSSMLSGFGPIVPSMVEFQVVDRVPCNDEESEAECVLIRESVIPDETAMSAAAAQQFPALPPGVVAHTAMSQTTDAVVDPDTLRPYRLVSLLTTRITLEAPGKPMLVVSEQRKEVSRTWEW